MEVTLVLADWWTNLRHCCLFHLQIRLITMKVLAEYGPAICYEAVAITSDNQMIPFGPSFKTEDEVWYWLHFDCDCCPEHRSIEVVPVM